MLTNYLKATVRILFKEGLYTSINIAGLAIGLASCFLIFSWIQSETNYDRFPGSDNLFRVTTFQDDAPEDGIASTYPMLKNRVLAQFPEIEQSARLFDQGFLGSKTRVTYKDKVFTDNRFYYADSTVLGIFPLKVLAGDAKQCLSKPNSIVITETTARKLFGNEDPIGKTVVVGVDFEYEVTAVFEDIPEQTHFHFDLLASMLSHPWIKNAENRVWSGVVFHTYVKLREGTNPQALEEKIATFMDNFPDDPDQIGRRYDFRLQPIGDIHLKSHLKFELEENGSSYFVNLFSTIGLLVLVVAIINYTNLTTARHTQRLKEVGVRKILGADRKQLLGQFITESLLVSAAAFLLAFFLIESARSILASLIGSAYVRTTFSWPVFGVALAVTVIIGVATGIIPALLLTSFQPVRLFKANLSTFSKGASLRKILVTAQFTVSIALTICTIIIFKQLDYIHQAKLGYDKDHTVVLNIGYAEVRKQYKALKSQLLAHSSITGATATSQLPTDIQTAENIDISSNQSQGVYCASVDPDFFEVMQVPIATGSDSIQSIVPDDSLNYFVVNEAAIDALGWTEEEALTKRISIRHGNQQPGPVRGVIQDFHFQSFHHNIAPLVLEFNPLDYQYMLVKTRPGQTQEALHFIETKWKEIAGAIPFEFMFLDQNYEQLYRSENRSSSLFMIFSGITLFISLLGLFGLASFAAEKRTKEIGVRKILGASAGSIVVLTSKDFTVLLIVSFFVAVPIGYYFMNTWLSDFAFKAHIGAMPFVAAGIVNMALALVILSYHVIRISRTNPVDTLKYE